MSIITPKTSAPAAPVQQAPQTPPTAQFRQPNTNEEQSVSAAEVPQEEAFSSKYSLLAKKEAELRRQFRAVKEREEKLAASEAGRQNAPDPREALKARFAADPYSVFEELGISHEQLGQLVMNPPNPVDHNVLKLQEEIRALKAATEKNASDMQAREKQQYEQAVNQIRNEVKMLAQGDERFETVREMGAENAAVELIEETFRSEGRLMTHEEALQEVEEHLLAEALRVANLKTVQARLKPPAPVEPAAQPVQGQAALKTLTNQATSSPTAPLSDKARRERAIAAFKGVKT